MRERFLPELAMLVQLELLSSSCGRNTCECDRCRPHPCRGLNTR